MPYCWLTLDILVIYRLSLAELKVDQGYCRNCHQDQGGKAQEIG